MLDPQAKSLLDFLASLGRPPIWDVPLAAAREASELMNVRFAGAPQAVAGVRDVRIPGPAGEIPARVYMPDGDAPFPVLVYYHGGGFTIGSIAGYDATLRALANASGCVVVSVDYRLAPEHPFPAGFEDCFAATRWIADHAASLGVDPSRLAVGGDSAGGNLAAGVALRARDEGGPAIAFQLLIYPTTDGDITRGSYVAYGDGHLLTTELCLWFNEQYVPAGHEHDVRHRVLHAVTHENLPPAHVLVAECDPLYDEAEAYAQKLRAAGVPTTFESYPGMIHGFFNYSGMLDQSRKAVTDAGAVLRAALGAKVRPGTNGSAGQSDHGTPPVAHVRRLGPMDEYTIKNSPTESVAEAMKTSTNAYTTATEKSGEAFQSATRTTSVAMSSAADRIRDMFKGASLPRFDMDAYVEARHEDIDAVAKATSVALGSAQTITTKQAELLKSSLDQLRDALTARKPGDSLGDLAGKERDLIQGSLSRTLDGMREMAEAAQKSQAQIFDIATDRVRSNVESLRGMFSAEKK